MSLKTSDYDLDFYKKFSINPEKNDLEYLAKCFNYRGNLPQVVIDKIVDSYDEKKKKFSNVELTVGDFFTGFESKPIVSEKELKESIKDVFKTY